MSEEINEVAPGSFIFTRQNALAGDICREMIERFERREEDQYPGRIGQTRHEDFDVKRSTDLVVSGNEAWQDIDRELFRSLSHALKSFSQDYPFFSGPFKDNGYAIQRTMPGEFYDWHIDGGSHEFAERQLVAIWYLNSLSDSGGETEFEYQQVAVKPEAGKLVLFPPFWTHRHRGTPPASETKYIATTWVVFA